MPNLFGCLQLGRETKCTLVFHPSANAIVKGFVYLGHSVNECPTFNFVLLASVLRDSMVKARISGSSFPPELAILQRLGCERNICWSFFMADKRIRGAYLNVLCDLSFISVLSQMQGILSSKIWHQASLLWWTFLSFSSDSLQYADGVFG